MEHSVEQSVRTSRAAAEAKTDPSTEFASFVSSGIHCLDGSEMVFIDPVRILEESYTRFRLSRPAYYSRSFKLNTEVQGTADGLTVGPSRRVNRKTKRKRRSKSPRKLNEREVAAENRHQVARRFLVRAHEALIQAKDLLGFLPELVKGDDMVCKDVSEKELNLVELGSSWRAPLYELTIPKKTEGSICSCNKSKIVPLYNNLIYNEEDVDVETEFLGKSYIFPGRSCFHMSDLREIHNLIPVHSDSGFNLIVIDPPWENADVFKKTVKKNHPSSTRTKLVPIETKLLILRADICRTMWYLPFPTTRNGGGTNGAPLVLSCTTEDQKLNESMINVTLSDANPSTDGALVVLWMTNREKFHKFVEEELFPAWEVYNITTSYWLKVKPDGSLISELDLFHHRPYECFLLGYVNGKTTGSKHKPTQKHMQPNQVIISIPGAHSRKPPLGKLLSEYVPGPKPARGVELFARELIGGWTSWGNEPLHFQDSSYFVKKPGSSVKNSS